MMVRIAQLQMPVYPDKWTNISQLSEALDALDTEAPDLVCLGEMFCCPYESKLFPLYAEPQGGAIWQSLSELAAEHNVYLCAGTVPECDGSFIYNTAYVFNREGKQIAKHRKMHLFNVDVSGGQYFRESETLTAGNHITTFDTEFGKVGLCICFDIRFPELSRIMALRGVQMILVPASFNFTTGPAHWELTFRARALDNQCYFVGTSDAFDNEASYHSWGHSIITDPWGNVVSQLDEHAGYAVCDLDLNLLDDIRSQLPLLSARRSDVYSLIENR